MKRLIASIFLVSSLSVVIGTTKSIAQVSVGVGISVGLAPPALPVYEQPPCPVEGYLWTPGYWYWGTSGYFWVPGVWVRPARIGFLWTPGYWGFEGGSYFWHGGYWGPHVGFYGGVCYGYGYGGTGFYGGRWDGGAFRYNTAVCRVNTTVIHNTYIDRTVVNNNTVNHSSFNGPRGVTAQPNAAEQSAMREQHIQATSEQQTHQHSASTNRNQLASANGGHPSTMARGSVGGQRFNAAGHAMNSTRAAHPATMNRAPHANMGRQQAPRQQRTRQAEPRGRAR